MNDVDGSKRIRKKLRGNSKICVCIWSIIIESKQPEANGIYAESCMRFLDCQDNQSTIQEPHTSFRTTHLPHAYCSCTRMIMKLSVSRIAVLMANQIYAMAMLLVQRSRFVAVIRSNWTLRLRTSIFNLTSNSHNQTELIILNDWGRKPNIFLWLKIMMNRWLMVLFQFVY